MKKQKRSLNEIEIKAKEKMVLAIETE